MLLLLAVLLHECGHIVVLLFTGGKLKGVSFGLCGITLKAEYPPSYSSKLMISLGGPLVGILVFLLFRNAGKTLALFSEINLWLSLFNLLPISFLDGGSAIDSFFLLFLPYESATALSHAISLTTASLLWAFSVYLFLFLNGSASLFLLSLWFFFSLLYHNTAKRTE